MTRTGPTDSPPFPKEYIMTPKPPRGFAALSPEQRRAIASMGGKASPVRGFSDPETAKKAGLRSGQVRKKELDSASDAADKNE